MPTLLSAHILALALAAADASAPPSWEQAESFVRKIQTVTGAPGLRGKDAAAPVAVSENELNSYVNLALRPKIPPALSNVALRLDRDRISGRADVDLDQLRDRLPKGGLLNPLSLLSGRVVAEFRLRLPNDNGFGSVEIEEVSLGSIPIPVSLIEQGVASSTRTEANPKGVDIHAPFRLPYGVKRVRLLPGRALLEF